MQSFKGFYLARSSSSPSCALSLPSPFLPSPSLILFDLSPHAAPSSLSSIFKNSSFSSNHGDCRVMTIYHLPLLVTSSWRGLCSAPTIVSPRKRWECSCPQPWRGWSLKSAPCCFPSTSSPFQQVIYQTILAQRHCEALWIRIALILN